MRTQTSVCPKLIHCSLLTVEIVDAHTIDSTVNNDHRSGLPAALRDTTIKAPEDYNSAVGSTGYDPLDPRHANTHGACGPGRACVGGGRVARLFCQRGGALEGLVGPCEAGARTAQRQHRRQEAQQQKRETTENGYEYLHLTVEYDDALAFLPPNLL